MTRVFICLSVCRGGGGLFSFLFICMLIGLLLWGFRSCFLLVLGLAGGWWVSLACSFSSPSSFLCLEVFRFVEFFYFFVFFCFRVVAVVLLLLLLL